MAERKNLQSFLPLLAAILPLLTINTTYLVAISVEHLPSCIPYLSGCTSVSSTGRLLPESVIFRAGMLPSAVIMLFFWQRTRALLRVEERGNLTGSAMRLFGIAGAASLVVYGLTVGLPGDDIQLLRRIGINGFAISNTFAQVLFVVSYHRLGDDSNRRLLYWLIALCLALPAIAILSEIAKWTGVERHMANNMAAWNAFVVLSAFYFVVYLAWRHHGYSGGFPTSPSE